MHNIRVILVRPQLGENIGAVARAMKNFGALKLRIVAPRDGWPNPRANELSAGALDVINNATLYANIEEASLDLHYLYGLTARDRFLNKPVISPEHFVCEGVLRENCKVGIVFGPENNGLNNHDISLIDKIVTIPTSPDFSSLNLAQSVVVVLYEIFKLSVCNVGLDEHRQISRATNQETIGLFEHLESELLSRNFFKVIEKRDGMIKNIRSIFKRIENLSSQDVSTLRGIIKNLSSRN